MLFAMNFLLKSLKQAVSLTRIPTLAASSLLVYFFLLFLILFTILFSLYLLSLFFHILATFTGSEKAFAAGADIKEMQPLTYVDCYTQNLFSNWIEVARLSKPVRFHIKHCVYSFHIILGIFSFLLLFFGD